MFIRFSFYIGNFGESEEKKIKIVANKNRFSCNTKEDVLIQNILNTEDFIFEMSSPLSIICFVIFPIFHYLLKEIIQKKNSQNGFLTDRNENQSKTTKKVLNKTKKHQRTESDLTNTFGNTLFRSSSFVKHFNFFLNKINSTDKILLNKNI